MRLSFIDSNGRAFSVVKRHVTPGTGSPVLFLAVGGTSTVVSLVTRFLAQFLVLFELAVVISHVFGMLCAFALNKTFVFAPSDKPALTQLWRFTLVNVGSLALTTVVGSGAYRLLLPLAGVDSPLTAHVIGLAACGVPSFLFHRRFSFGRSTRPTTAT